MHDFPPATLRRGAACCLLIATLTVIAGCETAIDPFQESDLYFSIFGFLDAQADTQYVRVTPLRTLRTPDPHPLDAMVTLEHLASGRKHVWRDSLFSFPNGGVAHNFWSAERLAPGETYRFTVARPDGKESTATVTLPDSFPSLSISTGAITGAAPPYVQGILATGVGRLAALKITVDYRTAADRRLPVQRHVFDLLDRAQQQGDRVILGINLYRHLFYARLTDTCPDVVAVEIYIAAAGSDWPDLRGLDPETAALPGAASNVQQGIGFLGGVVSRRIPWPEVLGALAGNRIVCEQRGRPL